MATRSPVFKIVSFTETFVAKGELMGLTGGRISVEPSLIVRFLSVTACCLILASLTGQFISLVFGFDHLKGLIPLFNLDSEENIPTYFSVLLLLTCSLLLAIIAVFNRQVNDPHISKWWILSLGFLFMAYDEAFQVHELLSNPVRSILGNRGVGLLYFSWVVPAIILVVFLFAYFLRFLLQLPLASAIRFLFAALLYLGGAIGVEMLGGDYVELHGMHNWTYVLTYTLEESLEIFGMIFFIWALLKYMQDRYQTLHITIGNGVGDNAE